MSHKAVAFRRNLILRKPMQWSITILSQTWFKPHIFYNLQKKQPCAKADTVGDNSKQQQVLNGELRLYHPGHFSAVSFASFNRISHHQTNPGIPPRNLQTSLECPATTFHNKTTTNFMTKYKNRNWKLQPISHKINHLIHINPYAY